MPMSSDEVNDMDMMGLVETLGIVWLVVAIAFVVMVKS